MIISVTDNNEFIDSETGKPCEADAENAIPNPNFGVVTETEVPDPVIVQNNPNNPYFGKKPLEIDEFRALVGQVLSGARYKRLRNDASFLWIQDMVQSPTFRVVDPDDKKGQFLKLIAYLTGQTGVLAEDGQLLLTVQELGAIMAAWPHR